MGREEKQGEKGSRGGVNERDNEEGKDEITNGHGELDIVCNKAKGNRDIGFPCGWSKRSIQRITKRGRGRDAMNRNWLS